MCIMILQIVSMLMPLRKDKHPRDHLEKLHQVNSLTSLQDIFICLIFLFSCVTTLVPQILTTIFFLITNLG